MGIYIRDMTLDEFWEYGDYVQTLIGTGRVDEIPSHGRLGDLDDLKERIKICVETAEDDCFDLGVIWYSTFAEMVALSPTIIPADPEGGVDG